MKTPELISRLPKRFPVFGQLHDATVDEIVHSATLRQATAGAWRAQD